MTAHLPPLRLGAGGPVQGGAKRTKHGIAIDITRRLAGAIIEEQFTLNEADAQVLWDRLGAVLWPEASK